MDVILLQQGKFEQLYAYFSPSLRAQIPFETVRKALKVFQLNMKTIETRQLADHVQWRDYFGHYMIDIWHEGDVITNFRMTEVLDRQTKVRYVLPFDDTWVTMYADEQYIFKKTAADRSIQIIAPAKGVVEKVCADGVVIRHSDDEYSYISGFTPRILAGKKVRSGAFLGTIGASEMLHFQVGRAPSEMIQQVLTVDFKRFKTVVKGDILSNECPSKIEKVDKLSDGLSLIDLLVDIMLWIPRAIVHFLKQS